MPEAASPTPLAPVLPALDVAVLASFAFIGEWFHHVGGNPLVQGWRIAWPFLAGCLAAALLTGSWRWRPRFFPFVGRSLAGWLLGMGLGFLLRGWLQANPPSPLFRQVAMLYTGSLWLLTRSLAWGIARRLGALPLS